VKINDKEENRKNKVLSKEILELIKDNKVHAAKDTLCEYDYVADS